MARKLGWVFILFSFASIFFLCTPAMAVPLTWTETYDPNPDRLIKLGGSYSFTHDLTNSSSGLLFVPAQDFIIGHMLTLHLYDDADYSPEIAYVNLPGIMSDNIYNFSWVHNNFGLSLAGLFSLNTLGEYNMDIGSILTAPGSRDPNTKSVPEPAVMVIFGTGLVFLGFIGRKFRHN